MDSSESAVHGQQEGATYDGHFECVCYHPLFLFNQFGACEAAKLRSGNNVPCADGWQELLEPVVKGYRKKGLRLLFRCDAAFGKPEVYEYLEQETIGYTIRLSANAVLQREIAHLLVGPTEWPSRKPIVTNLSNPAIGIVRFYNGLGTAEQWVKEGKYALNWTRLSCHKFVANQVRLELFVLAYNLGYFLRRLVLPESMKHWSLTSLQTRMIKIGGRLVRMILQQINNLATVVDLREIGR
jgi:hypothetical protein